jgi:hypothetical protein
MYLAYRYFSLLSKLNRGRCFPLYINFFKVPKCSLHLAPYSGAYLLLLCYWSGQVLTHYAVSRKNMNTIADIILVSRYFAHIK